MTNCWIMVATLSLSFSSSCFLADFWRLPVDWRRVLFVIILFADTATIGGGNGYSLDEWRCGDFTYREVAGGCGMGGWLWAVVGCGCGSVPYHTICRNSFVYSGFIQVPLKHASLNNILL